MTNVREAIRSERLALIELLETLPPHEWSRPSLCRGWTVQHVAAHLACMPAMSRKQLLAAVAKAGMRPNKVNVDTAASWAQRGTASILQQLRANADNDAKPPGVPPDAGLVDAVVHALDIRRPLDRPRVMAPDVFARTATFCARTRWPASVVVGGNVRRRIRGLRLVADGLDWSWGDGPEVRGSGEALLLLLTGRPIRAGELIGPGAATLYSRL